MEVAVAVISVVVVARVARVATRADKTTHHRAVKTSRTIRQ